MSGEKDVMSQVEEGKKVLGERRDRSFSAGGHIERRGRRTGLWVQEQEDT